MIITGYLLSLYYGGGFVVFLFNAASFQSLFFYQNLVVIKYERLCRSRMRWWTEAATVGCIALYLAVPMQFVGTKLLWWQYHTDDPRLDSRFVMAFC